jgi:hypothetical protein
MTLASNEQKAIIRTERRDRCFFVSPKSCKTYNLGWKQFLMLAARARRSFPVPWTF